MQVLPSEALLPYIKHYLFLETAGKDRKNLRFFSDGTTGIVFSFQRELMTDVNHLPASFLYGQITTFKDVYAVGDISMIIVVFHPGGLYHLLGMHGSELLDSIVDIKDVFGKHGAIIHEQLSEQTIIQNKTALLNHFFSMLLKGKNTKEHSIINTSLDFILKNKGQFSLKELTGITNYTERHIERTFSEYIGLRPKQFGNIVRLHHFLKLLTNKSKQNNLTAIAYDAGYADQAHLIKSFRQYTGITPGEYLYKTDKLATNFIKTR